MKDFSEKIKNLYYMREIFVHFHTIEKINSSFCYTKYPVFLQKSNF